MNFTQIVGIAALGLIPLGALSQAASPLPSQALTLSRGDVTGLIAEAQKVVTPHGVQQLIPVKINGIDQWLSIRGSDSRNPIMLYLHGGPGDPQMPTAWQFQRGWEDYFTVVQWDQRGAGKTLAANDREPLAKTINFKQMTSDAAEVVRYLQKTYGKKKIFLLGHSWGSVLGITLAQQHPEWFHAYIGVGQVVNFQEDEATGFKFALEQAKSSRNQVAEKELAAVAPYPGLLAALKLENVVTERKWLSYFGGVEYGRTDTDYVDKMAVFSPEYDDRDIAAIDEGAEISTELLVPELWTFDVRPISRFGCPLFLFEGRHDWTVPSVVAADWYQGLSAPSKQLVWFENSAHMPMLEEPGKFLFQLVTHVRILSKGSE